MYALPARPLAVRSMCPALCWQRGGQPLGHRLQSAMTGRGSTEKAAILDRLRQYRKDHGLGCLAIVAEKAGRDITDDVLRGVLQGEVTLDIKGWRQIGKALDKLAAAGEDDGG